MTLSRSIALSVLAALSVACGGGPAAPSVLIVSLDTTRADRLGSYGRRQAATPVLDALAARGVRFERAYSVAPITLPAHTSLHTGLVPPVHGLRDNGAFRLDPAAHTAAEHFAAAGWRTAAFVASFPLESSFGLDQGFEVYDDVFGERAPGAPYDERPAESVVDAALAWLPQVEPHEPVFLWTHFFDPHRPWRAPGASGDDDRAYQAEIAHADAQLGRLLDGLAAAGRDEQLHVVVVADHGEGLGEHGEATHAVLVHDATLRIPLLIAGPGVARGLRVAQPVSIVDVLPTLAALHDLPALQGVQGRDLAPAWDQRGLPARAVYGESLYPERHHGWSRLHTWIDADTKLVVAPSSERRWQLFDLGDDPAELHDLVDTRNDDARRLARELDAWTARLPAPLSLSAPEGEAADIAERLAALGYVGSEDAPQELGRHPEEMTGLLLLYHTGRSAARNGQLARAEQILQQLDALEADGLSALEVRAEMALARGASDPAQLALAGELFLQATQRSPTRKSFWRGLSKVQLALGDRVAALESFEQALLVATPTQELLDEHEAQLADLKRAAFAHEDAGEHADAQRLLQLLAERLPDDRGVQSALARVRAKLEG
ncbi:MAG: hypothetical protein DHS20C15_06500 [Planctomycetota bacterium]|nr:MAG: hypothetical protein DHS20C15_06500 [Planctomycetota bacterium]